MITTVSLAHRKRMSAYLEKTAMVHIPKVGEGQPTSPPNQDSAGRSAANVVRLKRKPPTLTKTYSPTSPYVVHREDQDDGSITYEVHDERPESYRFVCGVSDDHGDNGYAKHDAEQIARGLNLLVQYGKEVLPKVREQD